MALRLGSSNLASRFMRDGAQNHLDSFKDVSSPMEQMTAIYGEIMLERAERSARDASLRATQGPANWPTLVRSMFALMACEERSVTFSDATLHFHASMSDFEWRFSEWLPRFESLLSQVNCASASLHLEGTRVGTHSYQWRRRRQLPWLQLTVPPEVLQFEGCPRAFE